MVNTKTIANFINEEYPFQYLKVCVRPEDNLEENEYYVQMVTQPGYPTLDSPYVRYIDPINHLALVGIEKNSSKNEKGWYISKDFYKRNSRGIVCLVNVKSESLKDCVLLT